jgi:hypothetical protein
MARIQCSLPFWRLQFFDALHLLALVLQKAILHHKHLMAVLASESAFDLRTARRLHVF